MHFFLILSSWWSFGWNKTVLLMEYNWTCYSLDISSSRLIDITQKGGWPGCEAGLVAHGVYDPGGGGGAAQVQPPALQHLQLVLPVQLHLPADNMRLVLANNQGIARTQSPTNKNYAFELPTFGVIVGVSQAEVQWKGLTLEEPPSWSRLTSTPGKYEVTLSLLGTVLELNNFSFENFKTILLCQSTYLSKSIQYQYPFSSEV